MANSYYNDVVLDAESKKLTFEELQALKQELETSGFVLKYNNKQENLRDYEICIEDFIYYKLESKLYKIEPISATGSIKFEEIKINDKA